STGQEMENLGLENQLYSPNSRESRDVETRLGQLRVRLNTRIEQMVGEQFPQLGYLERNQVSHFVYFTLYREGSQRVINDLEAKIREFRDFTTRRPAQSARIAELQDDVTAARGMVSTIENEITSQTLNLEASGAELGMQIRIRQAPILDGNAYIPVEPNKIKLTALGSVLSLAIGLGLVVLAIFLDRSFKTVEDIERTLGLPVIGTLPVIQDDHFERKKKVRLLRWATIILGIIAVGAVGFLVIYPRLG
ncbi:hypothetical protein KDM41_15675, partial [bacterium]|nr:hypothetical protein [bacterium]